MRTSVMLITALLGATLFASCSSMPPQAVNQSTGPSAATGDTSVDITYVLGHNRHRFIAESKSNRVMARTYLDRQIIDQGIVDTNRYADFLQKVSSFMTDPRREPADQSPCRTPFSVTIRRGNDTQKVSGCRLPDEGALSHLVKDGEFLLYSKK